MTCECTSTEQTSCRVFRRGLSWSKLLRVTDEAGNLRDLTGISLEVGFTTAPGELPFLTLSVGSGVTLRPDQPGAGKGLAEVHATPAQTDTWPIGLIYFSIVAWPPGQTRDEVATGTVMVWPAILSA